MRSETLDQCEAPKYFYKQKFLSTQYFFPGSSTWAGVSCLFSLILCRSQMLSVFPPLSLRFDVLLQWVWFDSSKRYSLQFARSTMASCHEFEGALWAFFSFFHYCFVFLGTHIKSILIIFSSQKVVDQMPFEFNEEITHSSRLRN